MRQGAASWVSVSLLALLVVLNVLILAQVQSSVGIEDSKPRYESASIDLDPLHVELREIRSHLQRLAARHSEDRAPTAESSPDSQANELSESVADEEPPEARISGTFRSFMEVPEAYRRKLQKYVLSPESEDAIAAIHVSPAGFGAAVCQPQLEPELDHLRDLLGLAMEFRMRALQIENEFVDVRVREGDGDYFASNEAALAFKKECSHPTRVVEADSGRFIVVDLRPLRQEHAAYPILHGSYRELLARYREAPESRGRLLLELGQAWEE